MDRPTDPRPRRCLPNILSVSRIFLGLAFFLLLPLGRALNSSICLGIIALGMLTDYLDGSLARRTRTVTRIGKWLDPISDFSFFFFVYLSFHKLALMPLFLLILFLARETAMYAVVRPLYLIRGLDPAARLAGKIKTVFQNIGSMLIVFLYLLVELALLSFASLRIVSLVLLSTMVATSLASMYWYVKPLLAGRAQDRDR
jgi:CDP-diacylglycerol--glycerol-3-phosphate 3-phosphatidyltransferase